MIINFKITPLQMSIILAAYTGSKDFDHFKETEVWREQCCYLIDNEIIMLGVPCEPNAYRFAITEKGETWLAAMLNTPFPVKVTRWEMPQ